MIKRNRNWWGLQSLSTKKIMDVFPTRDIAREWKEEYEIDTNDTCKVVPLDVKVKEH
jgi:hypothetical protein